MQITLVGQASYIDQRGRLHVAWLDQADKAKLTKHAGYGCKPYNYKEFIVCGCDGDEFTKVLSHRLKVTATLRHYKFFARNGSRAGEEVTGSTLTIVSFDDLTAR